MPATEGRVMRASRSRSCLSGVFSYFFPANGIVEDDRRELHSPAKESARGRIGLRPHDPLQIVFSQAGAAFWTREYIPNLVRLFGRAASSMKNEILAAFRAGKILAPNGKIDASLRLAGQSSAASRTSSRSSPFHILEKQSLARFPLKVLVHIERQVVTTGDKCSGRGKVVEDHPPHPPIRQRASLLIRALHHDLAF